MKKRFFKYYLLILLMFSSLFFPGAATTKKIAVLKTKDITLYREALLGFHDVLSQKGIIHGENATIDVFFSVSALGKKLENEYDLIYVLGSDSIGELKEKVKNIPLLFALILNPVENRVVNAMREPGTNVTGASLNTPLPLELKMLHTIMPKIKNVLIMYSQQNAALVEEIKQGQVLPLEPIVKPVAKSAEVPEILNGTKTSPVDAVLLIPDMTVCEKNTVGYIAQFCLRNKIPFIGYTASLLKDGAVVCFLYDYKDIGRQAGELALRILAGESPEKIPVTIPRKLDYAINVKIKNYLNMEIPETVLKNAKELVQ